VIARRNKKVKERLPLPDGDYLSYPAVAASMGIATHTLSTLFCERYIPKPRNWGKRTHRFKISRKYALALIDAMIVRESIPDLKSLESFRRFFWQKLYRAR